MLQRYIIEREIPQVGAMTAQQLCEAARTSCGALDKLAGKVQWDHSYVAGDKTFCVYLADGEETIRQHAAMSGFPADKVTPIKGMIDPTTANG